MENKIYEWYEELGEPPKARLKETKKTFSLNKLSNGDLIEFPIRREASKEERMKLGKYLIQKGISKEIVIEGRIWPEHYVETIRRAEDNVGIELIIRAQAGQNWEGNPVHTIHGPNDALDLCLFNGEGYKILNKLLEKYNL
ncbi:MAG: hypothetical protein Q8O89_02760 [Nanoarchaeota archaeon]|nr:hypothetical protein [Nanoarchaeota archaeon]